MIRDIATAYLDETPIRRQERLDFVAAYTAMLDCFKQSRNSQTVPEAMISHNMNFPKLLEFFEKKYEIYNNHRHALTMALIRDKKKHRTERECPVL